MRAWLWTIGVLSVLIAATSAAQDAERYAPKEPPRDETPAQVPEAQATQLPDPDRVLHAQFNGVRFVDSFDKLSEEAVAEGGVSFDGTMLDDPAFVEWVQFQLGGPLTIGELNQVTSEVVRYYRRHDRPVVDAIVPEQDVTGGVVQVVVLEGRAGEVTAEGNRHFTSERLVGKVRLSPGDPISEQRLLEDLAWINNNPFRRVDLIFQRGDELGETDLVLYTQDRYPFRPYAGYDNTGTAATGENRLFAGFNWGDAFGIDHQLNYQFTASPDYDNFNSQWVSYIAPLPWRHTLTLLGNYTQSRAPVETDFNMAGESWQASMYYDVPLGWLDAYEHWLSFGFDFKQSNNNLEFGGASVFNGDTEILQWSVGYNLLATDPCGVTQGEVKVVFSPGDLTPDNTDAAFNQARSGADADYAYLYANLERETNLAEDLSWLIRFRGQLSTGELLGSEQLGFGGMYSIRGYDERQGSGDAGFIINNELHFPPISVAKLLGINVDDELQFLVFYDYGVAYDHGDTLGSDHHQTFIGVGPGLRYTIAPWVSIRYDYGIRLLDDGSGSDDTGRHHVSAVVSWTF